MGTGARLDLFYQRSPFMAGWHCYYTAYDRPSDSAEQQGLTVRDNESVVWRRQKYVWVPRLEGVSYK